MNLRLFWIIKRYLSNSEITNFNISIIWININRFTSKLTMNKLVFMKKFQALKDLVAPILDDNESRKSNLFNVLSDRTSCNKLSNQYKLRKIDLIWIQFFSLYSKILICLCLASMWNTLIKIAIFIV